MCSIVSGLLVQVGDKQKPSLLFVQCLDNHSDLYLPDRNLACCTALDTSYGLLPAVDQIGCGFVKLMYFGLKCTKDESRDASPLSFTSQ